MTCIVGIIDKKTQSMILGGDACGSNGYSYSIRKDSKIFKKGNILMGFTSSFRMGNILRYKLEIPSHPKSMGIFRYMNTLFIDAVKKVLKEDAYARVDKNTERGGTFLVAFKGRLFCIYDDYQVSERVDTINACGSGELVALGTMSTLLDSNSGNLNPKKILRLGLRAAESQILSVKGPFNYIKSYY